MRSSLLCTHSMVTHSSTCHCRPGAQLHPWWNEPMQHLSSIFNFKMLQKLNLYCSFNGHSWEKQVVKTAAVTPLNHTVSSSIKYVPFACFGSALTTCKPDVINLRTVNHFYAFKQNNCKHLPLIQSLHFWWVSQVVKII